MFHLIVKATDKFTDSVDDEKLKSLGVNRAEFSQVIKRALMLKLSQTGMILICLILSCFFKFHWIMLGVICGYAPIRKKFGGYHFDGMIRCFFMSILVFMVTGRIMLLALNKLDSIIMFIPILIILGSFTIIKIGVKDTPDIYASDATKKAFRINTLKRQGIRNFGFIILVVFILNFIGAHSLSIGIIGGSMLAFLNLYFVKEQNP